MILIHTHYTCVVTMYVNRLSKLNSNIFQHLFHPYNLVTIVYCCYILYFYSTLWNTVLFLSQPRNQSSSKKECSTTSFVSIIYTFFPICISIWTYIEITQYVTPCSIIKSPLQMGMCKIMVNQTMLLSGNKKLEN